MHTQLFRRNRIVRTGRQKHHLKALQSCKQNHRSPIPTTHCWINNTMWLRLCLWHSGRHAPGCPGAQFAFKNSMIRWFCNSHYVSQLAAFFIDARAKRSTVKSCQMFFSFGSSLPNTQLRIYRKETSFVSITWFTLGHLWFVGTHALLNKEKRHAYTCPFESNHPPSEKRKAN